MSSAFRATFRRFVHFVGIDRSIGFTVLARGWNITSGVINILLIARFLSPSEQGYYYTFSSLVALQVVFELGFSFVILQLAAHESSKLQIHTNGITGDATAHSRLASVLQTSVRWYTVAALLLATALMSSGFHFFSAHEHTPSVISWKLPWICVVIAVIFTFQMDPIFSFLEGCGFVADVANMRFTQAVTGSAFAWLALSRHHGLFAPAGVITGQALAGLAFLFSKRNFLIPLLRRNTKAQTVKWKTEIWPFQWRMAVTFSVSYCTMSLFNPVLFAYRGPVEAGKMGMSMSIAGALGAVAYAWMYTKASPFGKMIARGEFANLDRLFFRTLLQSGALLLCAQAATLGVLFVATKQFPVLGSRMLPMPVLGLLMVAIFLNHILYCEALYLRAHKREPLLVLSVLVAVLTTASTVLTAKIWGAVGVTLGYFACGAVFQVAGATVIFINCRRKWHATRDGWLGNQGLILE